MFSTYYLHKGLSQQELIQHQIMAQKFIDLRTRFNLEDINYIAGVDISYFESNGKELGACVVTVFDFMTQEVVEQVEYIGEPTFPYISGMLAFRELPIVMKTLEMLRTVPDIYVFDGNGILHERKMGIATYASYYLEKPCIGISKNLYLLNGPNTKEYTLGTNRGDYTDILRKGEVYGRILRTKHNTKPVYISCGNYIDLDTVTEICILFSRTSRIPLLTKIPDKRTKELRDIYKGGCKIEAR